MGETSMSMRMKLVLVVDYDEATTTEEEARDLLIQAAEFLAAEGLLSGEGPAVLDQWSYTVERVRGDR